jgi:hypothetical protein
VSAPINLNKIRKERARASSRARADENAVKFGQTKVQKEALKAQEAQAAHLLDGHKKEP